MRALPALLCRVLPTLLLAAPLTGCAARDFTRKAPLWPEGAPAARGHAKGDTPELYYYLPDPAKATGVAVIVAPGGSLAR